MSRCFDGHLFSRGVARLIFATVCAPELRVGLFLRYKGVGGPHSDRIHPLGDQRTAASRYVTVLPTA